MIKMTNPLIISRLIEAGYSVFLPIDGGNTVIVKHQTEAFFTECLTINVSQDQENSPILRCPPVPMLVAVCDVVTKTVWIIPAELVKDRKILRLGKQYEEYVIPEPTSSCYLEQKALRSERMEALKNRAKEIADKFANEKE